MLEVHLLSWKMLLQPPHQVLITTITHSHQRHSSLTSIINHPRMHPLPKRSFSTDKPHNNSNYLSKVTKRLIRQNLALISRIRWIIRQKWWRAIIIMVALQSPNSLPKIVLYRIWRLGLRPLILRNRAPLSINKINRTNKTSRQRGSNLLKSCNLSSTSNNPPQNRPRSKQWQVRRTKKVVEISINILSNNRQTYLRPSKRLLRRIRLRIHSKRTIPPKRRPWCERQVQHWIWSRKWTSRPAFWCRGVAQGRYWHRADSRISR